MRIFNKHRRGKPVVKGTLQLQVLECSVDDMDYFDLPSHENLYEDDNQLASLGSSTTVEYTLIQENGTMDLSMNNTFSNRSTCYIEALPLFEEMVSSFPNKYLSNKICTTMRNINIVPMSTIGINTRIQRKTGLTLFRENNTNKRSEKCLKFIHKNN